MEKKIKEGKEYSQECQLKLSPCRLKSESTLKTQISQSSTPAAQETKDSSNEEEALPDVVVDDAIQVNANEVLILKMKLLTVTMKEQLSESQ